MKLNTAFAVAILLPTDVLHGGTTEQSGRVLSAGTPIAFATVVLGSAVADADGSFTITYTPRRGSSAVLYLVARA